MALLQQEGTPGGQVIYPTVDADWRQDPAGEQAVEAALASSGGEALPSIRLGGYRVLAGSPAGVSHLLSALPKVTLGKVTYPFPPGPARSLPHRAGALGGAGRRAASSAPSSSARRGPR